MNPDRRDEHLSHIATLWTVVERAHRELREEAGPAQRQLLERYGPAIHRYLLGAVRDPDLADELYQEFALRLVRGDFRRADPGRGRFRNFLKTTLYHLVVDAQRRRRRQALPLPSGCDPAVEAPSVAEADEQFLQAWRAELLARTWEELERGDAQDGRHFHLILRFRTDHPEVRSPQMAEQLAPRVGKPISAEWVRKRLQRARDRFAELLVQEVARSLGTPTADELEAELLDLGLFEYCRSARKSGGEGREAP